MQSWNNVVAIWNNVATMYMLQRCVALKIVSCNNTLKVLRLDWQNNNLQVHHAFMYISLPSLHYYDVKMPNFTFCGGREHKTTTFFFFLWTSIQSFRIQLQKKIAKIWRIECDKISGIKFEAVRLHFLSDVFEAIAVVVA